MPRPKKQPEPEVPATVILKLSVPASTYEQYEQQAADWGVPVESLLSDRLIQCADHTSARPIYFDDDERQALETLTKRAPLRTAEEALEALINSLTIDFGESRVLLSAPQKRRLAMGARKGQTPAEYAGEIFLREVRRVAGA